MRFVVPVVAALALVVAAGCKTAGTSEPPKASTYDGEGSPKIKFGDGGSGGSQAGSGGRSGPGALDWAAVPFENLVYLPWKFLGGGLKGAGDGVGAGFSKDRLPLFGAIFSPVNAVAGFLTGAVEGSALSPGVIGPTDNFSHAMSRPTKHATSIWWYE